MPHINENCWCEVRSGRKDWIKKMNELGKQGFRCIWQSYHESDDKQIFNAYFYRKVFVSKAEFEAMSGRA